MIVFGKIIISMVASCALQSASPDLAKIDAQATDHGLFSDQHHFQETEDRSIRVPTDSQFSESLDEHDSSDFRSDAQTFLTRKSWSFIVTSSHPALFDHMTPICPSELSPIWIAPKQSPPAFNFAN